MLHLARKAFYPSPPPFPLLHVDTTWKFRAMYEFRDTHGRRAGHGPARAPEPRVRASSASTRSTTARRCTPTCGRPRGSSRRSTTTASTPPSAAPAATRRSRGPRSGSSRSARRSTAGTPSSSGPSCGASTTCAATPGETMRVFPLSNWTELDVWQYIHREEIPIVPLYFAAPAAGGRARRHADHGRRRPDAAADPARCPSCAASGSARSAATRSPAPSRATAATLHRGHPGDAADHHLGAPGPGDRPRLVRLDGEEEAGGLLLMAHASTSSDRDRHRGLPRRARAQDAAALHHLRQRRRRQEHADRPAALRVEAGVRGPPRRARGRLEEGRHPGRRPRLRPAGRRPRRRARAGHHHRRRLPLLLHRAPQVHRRRHPGPRAVHPQHGHRRVDRRPRGDPGRRPQGRAHPDPPAQLPRVAARHPPRRPRRQQARPRRLLAGGLRRASRPTTGPSPPRSASTTSPASRCRRCAATTSPSRARTRPGTTGRR